MSVCKYRVRGTLCLSCGSRIKGPAVVVVTQVREDDYVARACIVHESCQSAMLLDVPFDDETRPGALEGTPGLG